MNTAEDQPNRKDGVEPPEESGRQSMLALVTIERLERAFREHPAEIPEDGAIAHARSPPGMRYHGATIVCLPGEEFVELGLAVKRGSPFRTTLVIELSNAVETIYVPHRAAYAEGSYEVTNSNVQTGSGEIIVDAALGLLREAASADRPARG